MRKLDERMWSDGEPIGPPPTIDQAVNGGFPWLGIQCARCKTPSDVDLAAMKHPPTTYVHARSRQPAAVPEVRRRRRFWFALESRPLTCFAGIWTYWTSVRKVKEGETTNDIFAFSRRSSTPRSARHPSAGDARDPDRSGRR